MYPLANLEIFVRKNAINQILNCLLLYIFSTLIKGIGLPNMDLQVPTVETIFKNMKKFVGNFNLAHKYWTTVEFNYYKMLYLWIQTEFTFNPMSALRKQNKATWEKVRLG